LEQLWRDGLPVQPFTTTNSSKTAIIEALALALERADLAILPDAVLIAELQAFQAEPTASGMMRYSAPAGQHDDTVVATALAWAAIAAAYRARQQRPTTLYLDPETGNITTQMPPIVEISPI
jgi:hypothetical protein